MTFPSIDAPTPPTQADAAAAGAHRIKAIGLMCAAVSLFACLDATAKYLVGPVNLPVTQVVGMRFATNAIMMVVVILAVLGPRRSAATARTRSPVLQLARSFFLYGATILNFVAVKFLQLDQTITIFYASPLIVAALAGPLLGEWVGWRRMIAIMTGFCGIVLATQPSFDGIHWAFFLSFAATLCLALYALATRYVARYDATEVSVVYSPVVGLVLTLPLMIVDWVWPQDVLTWLLLFLTGALSGIGHWLLIIAHRHAPAPVLAPFVYSNMLTMIALGFLIFGDLPSAWTLTGASIVIGSGLYLFYRERRHKGLPRPVGERSEATSPGIDRHTMARREE